MSSFDPVRKKAVCIDVCHSIIVIKEPIRDETTYDAVNRNKIRLANCAFSEQIAVILLILICLTSVVKHRLRKREDRTL
jgi:hypothetical protein